MPNDVSYFKVPGDSATYSFNDADAESRIGALESTVNEQAGDIADNTTAINANASAIGTLSNLATSTKTSLVAAINEVDAHADANAAGIATLNATAFLRMGPLPSGSVENVFANGAYSLSAANTYTGLPSGVTVGTLLSFKPQPNSNYYAVHIVIALNRTVHIQNYTTSWSAWTQIGS